MQLEHKLEMVRLFLNFSADDDPEGYRRFTFLMAVQGKEPETKLTVLDGGAKQTGCIGGLFLGVDR